jgi:hypothetical protein
LTDFEEQEKKESTKKNADPEIAKSKKTKAAEKKAEKAASKTPAKSKKGKGDRENLFDEAGSD